nr:GNAT family N-acetyltransferase [Propionibacterium sp.]
MVLAPNIVVRSFVAEDAERVSELIRSTLFTSNAGDYPRAELESLAEWYSAAGLVSRLPVARRIVAFAEDGADTIVGTAARRENRFEAFFVHPDWQGRGVGSLLLEALEEDARTDALRAVWLESSLTAVGFYTKRGFVAVGAPRDEGDGLVIPMRKRLPFGLP